MLIRRVTVPVGATVQIIPPDTTKDYAGTWTWNVINPAASGGSVEIVDAPAKTLGAGAVLAAGQTLPPLVADGGDRAYAAGPATGSAVVIYVAGALRDQG